LNGVVLIPSKHQRVLRIMALVASVGVACAYLLAARDFVGWSFWQVRGLEARAKEAFADLFVQYALVVAALTLIVGATVAAMLPSAVEQEE